MNREKPEETQQTQSPAPGMEQPHAAGHAGAKQTDSSLTEKELEVLVDHTWVTRQPCARGAKAAGSALSCMSMSGGSRLRDMRLHLEHCVHFWTVHQQTRVTPEEATEMVRGLHQMMCKERLRAGFVQHGEGKASGRGSPKGQMEPGSSAVRNDRQQAPAGTWEIVIR